MQRIGASFELQLFHKLKYLRHLDVPRVYVHHPFFMLGYFQSFDISCDTKSKCATSIADDPREKGP